MSVTAKGLDTYDHVIFQIFILINLQRFVHFCFFLSRWGAECTLMRNKMNFFDLSKWLQ